MIKVNEYENGRVKSLGFQSGGVDWTAGVVTPGEYTFSTQKEEGMTVTVGRFDFLLPGQDWQSLTAGQSITIPGGVTFRIRAQEAGSYVCVYR